MKRRTETVYLAVFAAFTLVYLVWRIGWTIPKGHGALAVVFALILLLTEIVGVGEMIVHFGISANTRRLYESARSLVPLADLIEDASMIREEFFALERVGITAGASTPEAVVTAVESALLGHLRR